MKFTLTNNDTQYNVRFDKAVSIAIALDFNGKQPNHFGVPLATQEVYQADGFVGDTANGGSCNVTTIETTPHCNGTHTETVHHIVDQEVLINDVIPKRPLIAALVDVTPVQAAGKNETYRPKLAGSDQLITRDSLKQAFAKATENSIALDNLPLDAIVVRTEPNEIKKKTLHYGKDVEPAFFSIQAMEWIVEKGFDHLLVDLPSVDKMYDEGKLTCHHLFWNVPELSHSLTELSWTHKTITEMIFVPKEVDEGVYGLWFQAPSFCLDAAPSNPILLPLEKA